MINPTIAVENEELVELLQTGAKELEKEIIHYQTKIRQEFLKNKNHDPYPTAFGLHYFAKDFLAHGKQRKSFETGENRKI